MRQIDIEDYTLPLPFEGFAEAFLKTFEVALAEPERLQTPADLDQFLKDQDLSVPPATSEDVAAAKTLREELRALFDETRDEHGRSEQLNSMLHRVPVALALLPGATSLSISEPSATSLIDRVRTASAINVASAAARYGFSRLRVCSATPCRDAFIDRSKKGSRRFCCNRCANRWHVTMFRQRRRTEDSVN